MDALRRVHTGNLRNSTQGDTFRVAHVQGRPSRPPRVVHPLDLFRTNQADVFIDSATNKEIDLFNEIELFFAT